MVKCTPLPCKIIPLSLFTFSIRSVSSIGSPRTRSELSEVTVRGGKKKLFEEHINMISIAKKKRYILYVSVLFSSFRIYIVTKNSLLATKVKHNSVRDIRDLSKKILCRLNRILFRRVISSEILFMRLTTASLCL